MFPSHSARDCGDKGESNRTDEKKSSSFLLGSLANMDVKCCTWDTTHSSPVESGGGGDEQALSSPCTASDLESGSCTAGETGICGIFPVPENSRVILGLERGLDGWYLFVWAVTTPRP